MAELSSPRLAFGCAFAEAQRRRLAIAWSPSDVARPETLGRRVLTSVPLDEIAAYLDWPAFQAEHASVAASLLEHPRRRAAPRELMREANAMLRKLLDERLLLAHAAYGFWPACSVGEDIVLYRDDTRSSELARLHTLRQQAPGALGEPCLALADFVAPRSAGVIDYVGVFVASAALGADELARRYERAGDAYAAALIKALAWRMTHAFSELLHKRAREELGFGKTERVGLQELLEGRYRGLRATYGDASCPDASERRTVHALLEARGLGIELSEGCELSPSASLCGVYLSHPQARTFSIGRVDRDQLDVYARAKGVSPADVEGWLALPPA